jgi:hypothetical protein
VNYIKKGDDLYIVKSKYITHKYNITPKDKKLIDEKLDRQKQFLESHHIVIKEGGSVSLFDISMSANIRPDKYLAEVSARVDAFRRFAIENDYVPVFLTMTPESHFKPCRVIKTKKKGIYVLDDNRNFSGDFDNYVKDCRDNIQEKFRRFLRDGFFTFVKKHYRRRLPYFSSYEPSLDGALHKHSLFFVPRDLVDRFKSRFHHYFGDVQRDIKTEFDDDAGGVAAYILKYVLKSFRHSETGDLSDEGYWYAKHGLMRFTSARVLLPIYIWRSVRSPDRSYFEMSKSYANNDLTLTFEAKHPKHTFDPFKFKNYKLDRVDLHHYDSDDYYIGYEGIYQRSSLDYEIIDISQNIEPAPDRINRFKKSVFPIPVEINGISFNYDGSALLPSTIPVPYRRSMDLYQHFQKLDVETCNLQHYHYCKNELIKRGILSGDPVSLNDASQVIKF